MSDIKTNNIWLMKGDCLERMKEIESGSVDLILTDPPYGTTACKWDSIIPLEAMWKELHRIIKPNGAIVLFGSEPFSSALRISNIKQYKYDWIWDKKIPSGMCNAKIMPMKQSENISVFINGKNFYYPQMVQRDNPIKSGGMSGSLSAGAKGLKKIETKVYTEKYPTTHLVFDKIRKGSLHPTQKPIALMEYLIKTYTNENETVLDFTFGSGTTGVAAVNTNRKFIGIEMDDKYFDIGSKRIASAGEV
jgi:site-specific DNA-methyltransferase (adenine-specific)